jgi:hypothetical protein
LWAGYQGGHGLAEEGGDIFLESGAGGAGEEGRHDGWVGEKVGVFFDEDFAVLGRGFIEVVFERGGALMEE